eukprot:11021462-Lingulodinium_polyedra.AAC.1
MAASPNDARPAWRRVSQQCLTRAGSCAQGFAGDRATPLDQEALSWPSCVQALALVTLSEQAGRG